MAHSPSGLGRMQVAREVGLLALGVLCYFVVRGLTEGAADTAVDNAQALVAFERRLGVFWEPQLQELTDEREMLVTLLNWTYIWAHWPLITPVAIWLLLGHHRTYVVTRNAFLVSGAIGLVVFASFPVAPPRLAELGMEDTVTERSKSYRVLQPPALVNQYAALPSLHFGWDLLIGLALWRKAKPVAIRALGALVPVAMALAVVLTANHFLLDVVAGGALALLGLALAQHAPRLLRARSLAAEGIR